MVDRQPETRSAGNSKPVMINRDKFKFFHQLRVRYSEVDSQGIVFNAHYLNYYGTAVNEFMRSINYDYLAQVSAKGLDFFLVKATVEFLKPIKFDDIIEIGVAAHKIGTSSFTWLLAVFRKDEEECLASGELIWVCSRIGTNKSYPLPDDLVRLLQ